MPPDVAERFLGDAIDVDGAAVPDRLHLAGDRERRADAGLALELLDAHLEGALEPEVVQQSRVQPLRPGADPIERLLGNRAHTVQLGGKRARRRDLPPRASEQRADGGHDLAEVVVQLARDRALHVFLHAQRAP